MPGIQVGTLSGNHTIALDLAEVWTVAERLAGRPVDPLDPRFIGGATRPRDVSATRDGRMRLTLVGGFLGSGKTTWLRHQLHEGQFRDAVVVVNEAAGTPVDDALLQGATELKVLAGGCACCETKADLVALLRDLCDRRSRVAVDGGTPR